MTWRRLGSTVTAALVHAAVASAACTSTDACLQAIDAAQSGTRTISARFTQTKHVSLLDEPLVATGRFLFKRPDRMRLDIESPQPATILINGRDIRIPGMSESDKQQLAVTPMAAMFSELGAMFSGSPNELRQHFYLVAAPDNGAIEVTLTPTVPDWQKLFRTIRIRFVEPDLVVGAMHFDDALGDRLDITMSNVQRNQEVPDAAFESVAPAPRE